MNIDTRLSVPTQVMSRLVGDETVLLDLESGLYFGLDGVGRRIWESIGEGRTLGETEEAQKGEEKAHTHGEDHAPWDDTHDGDLLCMSGFRCSVALGTHRQHS